MATGCRWGAAAADDDDGVMLTILTIMPMPMVMMMGVQVYDPEEGRLLREDIDPGFALQEPHVCVEDCHVFESAQGRQLLAVLSVGTCHPRQPGDKLRSFLDVWDLGEGPPATGHVRPAHHLG
jgi:hypothetical protein